MIISASRRTDIPAFYAEWLLHRLRAGFVDVPNPMNPHLISRVPLSREHVSCIVLWTKNATPMLPLLHQLDAFGLPFYFQFTLNPYGADFEKNLPHKQVLQNTLQRLGTALGKERVIWRYDPVIVTEHYTVDWHAARFFELATALSGFTERCIFSFVDIYKKFSQLQQKSLKGEVDQEAMLAVAEKFSKIGKDTEITLTTCAEPIDLTRFGIQPTGCIDTATLEKVTGLAFSCVQSKQRSHCACLQCVDIGIYDTCLHECLYCYASSSAKKASIMAKTHDPLSSLLVGHPQDDQRIVEKKGHPMASRQLRLV